MAEIHVAKDGDDSNDGLTPETAFATLARAYEAIPDGGTICIGPGTWDPGVIPAHMTLRGRGTGYVG